MQNRLIKKAALLNDSRLKFIMLLVLFTALILISNHVFAKDLLLGTDADIKDTMTGTGKKWLLWIDGGVSLAAFAYSKKPIVFFSVLGISLFITALVTLAGA